METIKKYCVTINPWIGSRLWVKGRTWKDYGVMTLHEQKEQLISMIRFQLDQCEISHMDLTFEITKKGNYHVHGTINCSFEQISDFRKKIYQHFGHASQRANLMDMCITVKEEYSDDGKWKEYMTKVSKKIHRILGKNYKYVDNHLQGLEDLYIVD